MLNITTNINNAALQQFTGALPCGRGFSFFIYIYIYIYKFDVIVMLLCLYVCLLIATCMILC